jgi:hypothetical protein
MSRGHHEESKCIYLACLDEFSNRMIPCNRLTSNSCQICSIQRTAFNASGTFAHFVASLVWTRLITLHFAVLFMGSTSIKVFAYLPEHQF